MARGLQSLSVRWSKGGIFLLGLVALWQVAGCVVPPEEELFTGNRPPVIDWSNTSPPGVELFIGKQTGSTTEFSLEEGVYDPDGDELEFEWYVVTDKDEVVRKFGDTVMSLDAVCNDVQRIRDAERLTIVVVVSDHPLKWIGPVEGKDPGNEVDPGQDEEGNDLPLIKRIWVADLTGECP